MFSQCLALYRQGKVTECREKLEKITSPKFETTEWTRENNILVCKTQEIGGKNEGKIKQGFTKLLQKIQGVVLDEKLEETELAVTYNLCYLHTKEACYHGNHHDALKDITKIVSLTLQRLRWKKARLVPVRPEQTPCELMKSAASKLHKHHGLCLLSCAIAIQYMLTGDAENALNILYSVPTHQADATQESLVFPLTSLMSGGAAQFPPDGTAQSPPGDTTTQDIVSYITGIAHMMRGDNSKTLEAISSIISQTLIHKTLYMKGFVHLKNNNLSESLRILADFDGKLADDRTKALIHNLTGCVLAKKGLHQSAVQQFRDALACDFAYLLPLYNISLQYQKLGWVDAELESLNLLVTGLESKKNKSSSVSDTLVVTPGGNLLMQQVAPDISLNQALYALATRCMEKNRFDVASQRLLDLVAMVMSGDHCTSVSCPVELPSMKTLLHQTAFALLKSGQFKECIAVCERLLDKHTKSSSTTDNNLQDGSMNSDVFSTLGKIDMEQLSTINEDSRKRPRSEGSKSENHDLVVTNTLDDLCVDVVALKYKADALCELGHLDEALHCLTRMAKVLEAATTQTVQTNQHKEPQQKKARLDSDVGEASVDDVRGPCLDLLVEAYSGKAALLTGIGKLKQALHFSRLTLHLKPNNIHCLYNHCLLLWQLGRPQEGATCWLRFRQIETRVDGLQLGNIIRTKRAALKTARDDGTIGQDNDVGNSQKLELDIRSLEHLKMNRSKNV